MTYNAGLTLFMDGYGNLGSVHGSFDADYLTFNGGGIWANASFTINANRGMTLTGNGFIGSRNNRTLTYGGVITGSGNLTKLIIQKGIKKFLAIEKDERFYELLKKEFRNNNKIHK